MQVFEEDWFLVPEKRRCVCGVEAKENMLGYHQWTHSTTTRYYTIHHSLFGLNM
jgi:hypothetical protein